MKEAIYIIRHRWREVGVILALSTLDAVLNLDKFNPRTHTLKTCAVFIVGMTAFAIYFIVSLGLFRSIAMNAFEVRRILDLFSIGKKFFWRSLGLHCTFSSLLPSLLYLTWDFWF